MSGRKQIVATAYTYRGEIIHRIADGQAVIFIGPDRPVYFLNPGEAESFVDAKNAAVAACLQMASSLGQMVGHVLISSVTG